MAEFLTNLITVKVKEPRGMFGRATWRVLAPLVYYSDVLEATVIVPTDFETDFASVPRLPLVYALTGDTGHKSATVHDFLCRKKLVERDVADKVFREALQVEGVPGWRRALMYAGVRFGSITGVGR